MNGYDREAFASREAGIRLPQLPSRRLDTSGLSVPSIYNQSVSGGSMPLPALLAIPGVPQVMGSVLSGFMGWLGKGRQAKATREAADIHARAARTTGVWKEDIAREQLELQRKEARLLRLDTQRAEEANWAMERAREKRLYGQAGDEAFNLFGLTRHGRRLDFNETAADRANRRAEFLSGIRTGQGRYAATQRRLGEVGRQVGAAQPAGGREIAPLVEPTALVQSQWAALRDPRQTAFEHEPYVPPISEV